MTLHPLGAILLIAIGVPAATPFVILHGAGNGMLTITRDTMPLALFGPAGYGLRTGLIAAWARILQGAAPLVFGLVLDRAGPEAALVFSGALAGMSLLALLMLQLQQILRLGRTLQCSEQWLSVWKAPEPTVTARSGNAAPAECQRPGAHQ